MPRNLVLSGLLPALVVATALVVLPLEIVTEAQQQTPAGPAPTATGRAGGLGLGGGRGGGPTMTPSALRAIPAEATAAKAKDPNWKAPRTAWGHPDLDGVWTSDDMRGIPTSRQAAIGTRESLTPEEFARRAGGDESSRDRAVNQETFLRNEFGVRTFGYTSFVVDPPNGQIPQVTPAALARRKAMANVGTFGQGPFNIPLDNRPHIASSIKQYMGDARGRWEGDTLVVETTNFTDKTSFSGLHSDQLKLTEWFTRIDPEMIDYRIRVEDPETWTAPFTVTQGTRTTCRTIPTPHIAA